MITWSNADKLASWKKLMSLKGMVSVKEQLSSSDATKRVNDYNIKMGGGLSFNYAAKQVNEQIIKTFEEFAEEQQLVEKYEELLNGSVINTGEKRMVLHQLARGQLGKDVIVDGVNKKDFYAEQVKKIADLRRMFIPEKS